MTTLDRMTPTPATLAWDAERDRLIGIAYRMLGDYGHAEDVVSEVAIDAVRREREAPGDIDSWPAWLTTVCVRRSIDRVRHETSVREDYPGPWLPEPVSVAALPDEVVADRELLSLALLHLAEQLAPEPRAALVLHRAFGMTAGEIGRMLEKNAATVRQMISRAERRLRIDPDAAPPRCIDREGLARLAEAIGTGDIEAVLGMIAPDAVLWSDGGGKVNAALNPIFGAEKIVRFLSGILLGAMASGGPMEISPVEVNGEPALLFTHEHRLDLVTVELDADGLVRGVRQVSNPDKLTRFLR